MFLKPTILLTIFQISGIYATPNPNPNLVDSKQVLVNNLSEELQGRINEIQGRLREDPENTISALNLLLSLVDFKQVSNGGVTEEFVRFLVNLPEELQGRIYEIQERLREDPENTIPALNLLLNKELTVAEFVEILRARSRIHANECPKVKRKIICLNVTNECWSPGVKDVDCPAKDGFGLCCFDGCRNACLRSPPTPTRKPSSSSSSEERTKRSASTESSEERTTTKTRKSCTSCSTTKGRKHYNSNPEVHCRLFHGREECWHKNSTSTTTTSTTTTTHKPTTSRSGKGKTLEVLQRVLNKVLKVLKERFGGGCKKYEEVREGGLEEGLKGAILDGLLELAVWV